jgi:lipopolysaccharide export system protein LptA
MGALRVFEHPNYGNTNSELALVWDSINPITAGGSIAILQFTVNSAATGQTTLGFDAKHFYVSDENVTVITGDFNLHPGTVTLPATTYTVTYNGNGASGNPPTDSNTYAAGANPGYTFAGWSLTATGAALPF